MLTSSATLGSGPLSPKSATLRGEGLVIPVLIGAIYGRPTALTFGVLILARLALTPPAIPALIVRASLKRKAPLAALGIILSATPAIAVFVVPFVTDPR
jgi:hypothetical protein